MVRWSCGGGEVEASDARDELVSYPACVTCVFLRCSMNGGKFGKGISQKGESECVRRGARAWVRPLHLHGSPNAKHRALIGGESDHDHPSSACVLVCTEVRGGGQSAEWAKVGRVG